MIHYMISQTILGKTILAQSDNGLCFVAMDDSEAKLVAALRANYPNSEIKAASTKQFADFSAAFSVIQKLEPNPDLKLYVQGTKFQLAVWQQLCRIPVGQTITYSELAKRIGQPKATRAVANACGANLLAVIIPCHRVVRKSGDLGGYAWGVERKAKLLELEKAQFAQMFKAA